MVEIKNLSKNFGKKEAVRNLSCSFDIGVYGLLGQNGAGKTTLIRCMLELYPHKGEILLGNVEDKQNAYKIGYLPQKNSVFSGLTVEEHLHYFANLKCMEKDKISGEIDRVLELVNLSEYRKQKGRKLSGGMIRRLGIAQALLNKPELVIFDEPTTGLDPEERMRFKNIIRRIGKESVVIMSTHIVEDVEAVCDQILIMKDGEILATGTQEDISHLAEGKVYEIPRESQEDSCYVEKEFLIDGVEMVRILTNQTMNTGAVKPTIEDGYMCVLKGI